MSWKRSTLGMIGVMGLAACGEVIPPTEPTGPSFARGGGAREAVIVVFQDDVANARGLAMQLANAAGAEPTYTYEYAIKGFAATLPVAALDGIRRNPNVAYIELDGIVSTQATQLNATWGLDRIDQRDRPLNGTYVYNADGTGVRAYILDTGIRPTHNDFGARVSSGYTAITDGQGTNDCNGHGTHVAGTVGGTTWGVAKNVALVAVRVLNCQGSGTTSGVIAGVDWVKNYHVKPAVANMSLGGGASSTLDAAVANAISAGVTFAIAAGNSNANACNYSPARVASALTVGSTTSTDARSSFSNFGSCLDIFAPGSSITSAWHTSNTATATISGTSMAAPHVAGVAALVLQGAPTNSPADVATAILNNASVNKVSSAGTNSPNRLLFSDFSAGGGTPTNQPPIASFTFSCTNLACSFNGSGSSDSDGSITSYAWTFGDGTSGSGVTTSRTYGSAGTRTVTLTVTDDDFATGSQSQSVTVTAPPSSSIGLSVSMTKVKGNNFANLSWTGAGPLVDIFRNGTRINTVSGTTYKDSLGKGSGSRTYHVCNAGTSTCSSTVTVTY